MSRVPAESHRRAACQSPISRLFAGLRACGPSLIQCPRGKVRGRWRAPRHHWLQHEEDRKVHCHVMGDQSDLSDLWGDSKERARVCLDPMKTFRWEALILDDVILRLPSSLLAGTESSSLSTLNPSGGALRVCSCCKCRSSFFFYVASCKAHCFFSFSKSSSVLCNSSLRSRTRLS